MSAMASESTPTVSTDAPAVVPPTCPSPASGRPDTSATELNLRNDRQKAQTSYQRAAQAEQDYRAKRRATFARKDIKSAKEHLTVSATSFKEACACAWSAIKAGPAVVKEKQVKMREDNAEKRRSVAEAKKKKWEEKAKKSDDSSASEDAPAAPVVEATPVVEAAPAAAAAAA
ncbi:hypothetical protein PZA11_004366 [Diplocarpon coronariae]|uniref:Uncharacterized protein n=1 Tax=Diplocarpon coronariae TaxID=2795749 RepID=A0A218YZU8_9HELO|nr:hypothetical protein JHW43_003075 [Diplocarpon mali]OWP00546.1 hypothetical protein B2J93_4295 [Marssonina coronariae]